MNRQDSFVSFTHINSCYMKSTLDIHFHAARRVSFHNFLRKRFTANRAFNFGFCVVFVWCVTSFTSGGMTFYHRSGKCVFEIYKYLVDLQRRSNICYLFCVKKHKCKLQQFINKSLHEQIVAWCKKSS